jgi:hypothetical protein
MPAMGQMTLTFFDCNIWQSWGYNVTSKNWPLFHFQNHFSAHKLNGKQTIMEERGVIIYWMFYEFVMHILFLLLKLIFVLKKDWIMTYSWN